MSDATKATLDQPETAEPSAAEKRLAEIVERNREGMALHDEWQEKAEAAKAAKKRWEAHQESTQRFIAGLDETFPLFDGAERKAPPAPAEPVVSDPAPSPEPWRAVPTADLGRFDLSPKIVEKLTEAGLSTIGQLADWSASEKRLTDIPGVGASTATKIEEALDRFWASQPKPAEPEPDRLGDLDAELAGAVAEAEALKLHDPEAFLRGMAIEALHLDEPTLEAIRHDEVKTFGELEDFLDGEPSNAGVARHMGLALQQADALRAAAVDFRRGYEQSQAERSPDPADPVVIETDVEQLPEAESDADAAEQGIPAESPVTEAARLCSMLVVPVTVLDLTPEVARALKARNLGTLATAGVALAENDDETFALRFGLTESETYNLRLAMLDYHRDSTACTHCKGEPKTICPACGKLGPTEHGGPVEKPKRRRKAVGA